MIAPHTIKKFRKTTTLAPNNSRVDGFEFVSEIKCFVQPVSVSDSADILAKRGIVVNCQILFFTDPGLVDENTAFTFDHRGRHEIHENRGIEDQCNLGKVIAVYTYFRIGALSREMSKGRFSISCSSSVLFRSS